MKYGYYFNNERRVGYIFVRILNKTLELRIILVESMSEQDAQNDIRNGQGQNFAWIERISFEAVDFLDHRLNFSVYSGFHDVCGTEPEYFHDGDRQLPV